MQSGVIHLNRYYHFTELMRDPAIECLLSRYVSNYDQTLQSALILRTTGKEIERLFFFFHGMDGDCGDGVVVREIVKELNAMVVCMGGRGSSWGSDAFLADAEQIISKYSKGFQGYYMIGISMGGTQVLALAGLLPKELRQSILGVIALIPGSDLPSIALKSSNERVRQTIIASVNGNMSELKQRSPSQLISHYKKNLPFVIFYNENDTLLLSERLEEFIVALHKKHPVSIFTTQGEHNFTYKYFDYGKLFKQLGKTIGKRFNN